MMVLSPLRLQLKRAFEFFLIIAKQFKQKLMLILHGVWALPAIILIRSLRKYVLIRMGTFIHTRIGHFAPEGAEHFARLKEQAFNTVDWYWLPKVTCNKQEEKMIKRNLPVFSLVEYLDRWNRIIPGGNAHIRPFSYTGDRDIEGLFEKYESSFSFLPEEENFAKGWLRDQGLQEGEPFVCLLARDDAYLDNERLHSKNKGHWSYHSYRNSEIATYVPAMEWLADQGYWVLRMGKIMSKPIPSEHPKIIDYAFHEEKSDLLDIWLFANCNFCITTSTGLDCISHIYKKPLLIINFAHLKL